MYDWSVRKDNAAFCESGPYEPSQIIHLLSVVLFRVLMILAQLAHFVR